MQGVFFNAEVPMYLNFGAISIFITGFSNLGIWRVNFEGLSNVLFYSGSNARSFLQRRGSNVSQLWRNRLAPGPRDHSRLWRQGKAVQWEWWGVIQKTRGHLKKYVKKVKIVVRGFANEMQNVTVGWGGVPTV